MRALKSPAMSERASVESVLRKLSLNPRTPTRAATPMATDNTTKPNFPGADLRSRHAIAAALFHPSARLLRRMGSGSAIAHLLGDYGSRFVRQSVFHDPAVFQHDLAIGPACHL